MRIEMCVISSTHIGGLSWEPVSKKRKEERNTPRAIFRPTDSKQTRTNLGISSHALFMA